MSRCTAARTDGRLASSREEIESLCIIFVVGGAGCDAEGLAVRLGLPAALAGASAIAAQSLVEKGWLCFEDAVFTATEAGSRHLAARLDVYGVAPPPRGG